MNLGIIKIFLLTSISLLILLPEVYYINNPELFLNSLKLICLVLSFFVVFLSQNIDHDSGLLSRLGYIGNVRVASIIVALMLGYGVFNVFLASFTLLAKLGSTTILVAFPFIYWLSAIIGGFAGFLFIKKNN